MQAYLILVLISLRCIIKVGDLVKYGKWYNNSMPIGIAIEESMHGFFLVVWSDMRQEWEDKEELEVINEMAT
tara:strand:- start:1224 stop:1439 length:216 start_codon:yes stop_codon:yes gene_type:complete